MEIGRKILNLRKDRGVAQRSLADQTAVTPSALSRIESGIHHPRGPVALRLARRLGVTADYILDENAPYPPPAYEILENIREKNDEEPRDEKVLLSERELRIIDALRQLDGERKLLLERSLDAPREQIRFVAWLLGVELPGEDSREMEKYREMVRARID